MHICVCTCTRANTWSGTLARRHPHTQSHTQSHNTVTLVCNGIIIHTDAHVRTQKNTPTDAHTHTFAHTRTIHAWMFIHAFMYVYTCCAHFYAHVMWTHGVIWVYDILHFGMICISAGLFLTEGFANLQVEIAGVGQRFGWATAQGKPIIVDGREVKDSRSVWAPVIPSEVKSEHT